MSVVLIRNNSQQALVVVEGDVNEMIQDLPIQFLTGRKPTERLLKTDTMYSTLFRVEGVLGLLSKQTEVREIDSGEPDVTLTLQSFRWKLTSNQQETLLYPTEIVRRSLRGVSNV